MFFSLYSEQKSECFPERLTALFSHKVPSSGCWFEIAFSRIQRSLMSLQYTSPLLPSAHSYIPLLFHTFPPAVRLYETQDILCVILRSTWLYRDKNVQCSLVFGPVDKCVLWINLWPLSSQRWRSAWRSEPVLGLVKWTVQIHPRRVATPSQSANAEFTHIPGAIWRLQMT